MNIAARWSGRLLRPIYDRRCDVVVTALCVKGKVDFDIVRNRLDTLHAQRSGFGRMFFRE
jgi:hypothetical protein